MTRNPIYVMEDDLAAEAVKAVSNRHIDDLVVLNAEMTPVGIVDLQDLARLKLVYAPSIIPSGIRDSKVTNQITDAFSLTEAFIFTI